MKKGSVVRQAYPATSFTVPDFNVWYDIVDVSHKNVAVIYRILKFRRDREKEKVL